MAVTPAVYPHSAFAPNFASAAIIGSQHVFVTCAASACRSRARIFEDIRRKKRGRRPKNCGPATGYGISAPSPGVAWKETRRDEARQVREQLTNTSLQHFAGFHPSFQGRPARGRRHQGLHAHPWLCLQEKFVKEKKGEEGDSAADLIALEKATEPAAPSPSSP